MGQQFADAAARADDPACEFRERQQFTERADQRHAPGETVAGIPFGSREVVAHGPPLRVQPHNQPLPERLGRRGQGAARRRQNHGPAGYKAPVVEALLRGLTHVRAHARPPECAFDWQPEHVQVHPRKRDGASRIGANQFARLLQRMPIERLAPLESRLGPDAIGGNGADIDVFGRMMGEQTADIAQVIRHQHFQHGAPMPGQDRRRGGKGEVRFADVELRDHRPILRSDWRRAHGSCLAGGMGRSILRDPMVSPRKSECGTIRRSAKRTMRGCQAGTV